MSINGVVITFVDISAQKQGDELRRLGTVVRDSNDAVTLQDLREDFGLEPGRPQLYGWSEAEALTMNALELTPEPKRVEMRLLYQKLVQGEAVRSFETQRITRDGRTLDVWMTLTTLVNDAGQPVGIATTERDISDRKQASQILLFENRAVKAANQWLQRWLDQENHAPSPFEACRILVERPATVWPGSGGCRSGLHHHPAGLVWGRRSPPEGSPANPAGTRRKCAAERAAAPCAPASQRPGPKSLAPGWGEARLRVFRGASTQPPAGPDGSPGGLCDRARGL
jgi:PAS domain S-box-containing protein